MNRFTGLILLLLCTLNSASRADNFRFRVYLKDKAGYGYTIGHPEQFLSQAALERRKRQGIPIDETDLPLPKAYLDTIQRQGARLITQSKWMQTVVVESADSSIAERLSRLPIVRKVQWVWRGKTDNTFQSASRTDNDALYEVAEEPLKDFYGYGKKQLDLLGGRKLHRKGFRGEGMRIAVIDAGFCHADRIDAFRKTRIAGTRHVSQPDRTVFQGEDHGTKVLSCLASRLPNVLVGTAPEAEYWLLVSEDSHSEFPIEEDYWLAAAEYADSVGVDIITSSLGYYEYDDPALSYQASDLDGKTALISRAATMAARKGILVFSSAGNEGNSPWQKITVPADADSIVTVGAVDEKKHRSSFSSFGYAADGRVKPDVVAMGTACSVIDSLGELRHASGTSFSTPILAGMTACLWQALPWLTAQDIIRLLHQYGSLSKDPNPELGYGLPNLYQIYRKEKKHGPKNP